MAIEPILRVQFDKSLQTKYNLGGVSGHQILDNYAITAKGFTPEDPGATGGAALNSQGANADLNNGDLKGGYIASIPGGYYAEEPYRLGIAVPVGFETISEDETIEFYFEPALSFTMIDAKDIYVNGTQNLPEKDRIRRENPFYTFGYVVYAELYIRPIPQLEWYMEFQTGGATVAGDLASANSTYLVLNAAAGITWYF